MRILDEDSRRQLIQKSTASQKGRERYKKRTRSRVSSSVREYNLIDMNKLFKNNILDVNVPVRGETNDYLVRISFGGVIDALQDAIAKNGDVFNLRVVMRALTDAFRNNDVYIHCTCPDWTYRFAYWATMDDINSGEPQTSNGKWIRNPDDSLGSGCKHSLLVLNNSSWLVKVASTIHNYVNYIEKRYQKQYADIIYPALFGKPYEEPVQTSLFDTDELETDAETIDVSNEEGRTSGQFKLGNKQGVRFAPSNTEAEGQTSLDLDNTEEAE